MKNKGMFEGIITAGAAEMVKKRQRIEIERAIDNVKRTEFDRWFRREFYRAAYRAKKRYERAASGQDPSTDNNLWKRR